MRADRLISLMLLLHARRRMTAQELAERLEVSERTIYRDIDALTTAGVPVYTQSGTNGGVFLDENYRISLTGLSRAEIQSLFVSGNAGPLKDLGLAQSAEGTLLKLFAALPSMQRAEVERVRERIYIDSANWFQIVEPSPYLALLQEAVWSDRRVEVSYQPVEGERGKSILDAYALVAKANIWYLVGRKQNGDIHNYRIGRLYSVALLDEHFERDPHFDLAAYWQKSCQDFEKRMAEIFPPYRAIVRVHRKGYWYFPGYLEGRYEQIGEADGDWTTLRVVFDSFDDARMRVLGLGTLIEVVEPVELYQSVLDTARAIVAFHDGKG